MARWKGGHRQTRKPKRNSNSEIRKSNSATRKSKSETRAALLVDANLTQQLEIAEHFAGAEHHGRERIVGYGYGQAGFFANAFIEIFQERAAAGENDSAVTDIGGEFRWCAFKGDADCVHDSGHTFREGFADFAVVNGAGARNAFD